MPPELGDLPATSPERQRLASGSPDMKRAPRRGSRQPRRARARAVRAPRADDPRIVDTVKVIDATLKVETPQGPCWHRYNGDGYGEHEDGSPFDSKDRGIGRAWPLLTGERAHYELEAGRRDEAIRLLHAMENFAGDGGMIPEQVWDTDGIPERGLFQGRPSGSAMPLVWAHAEYVKLRRSLAEGKTFDRPPQTYRRYVEQKTGSDGFIWRFKHQWRAISQGKRLRVETQSLGPGPLEPRRRGELDRLTDPRQRAGDPPSRPRHRGSRARRRDPVHLLLARGEPLGGEGLHRPGRRPGTATRISGGIDMRRSGVGGEGGKKSRRDHRGVGRRRPGGGAGVRGAGASIGLLARGRDGLEGAKRDVEARGGRGLVLPTDVSDAEPSRPRRRRSRRHSARSTSGSTTRCSPSSRP